MIKRILTQVDESHLDAGRRYLVARGTKPTERNLRALLQSWAWEGLTLWANGVEALDRRAEDDE